MSFGQLASAVGPLGVLACRVERVQRGPEFPAVGLVRLPRSAAERNDRRLWLLGKRRPLYAGGANTGSLTGAFGRQRIERPPVPKGWDRRGNGRRFFAFPESTTGLSPAPMSHKAECIKGVIANFRRAVVLTPDTFSMEEFLTRCVPEKATRGRPDDQGTA